MKDDDEIKNYWSKLLIFLLIVGVGYLTYYKFLVYDKKNNNINANKVEEKINDNKENNVVENEDGNATNSDNKNNKIEGTDNNKVENKDPKSNILLKKDNNISNDDKIEINKILRDDFSYFLSYDNDESKFRFSGNIFNDYNKTFLFTKYIMNSKGKVQVVTGMDEEGNILGNTYSKCSEGTGSASIKEKDFNVYYKNLFGKEFDKTKFDSKMFVDGYICTSMPSGYTATQIPVLKVVSKTFNNSLNEYTLNITVLSNLVDASEYSDISVLTWPKEAETSHLEFKYKENSVTDYQIISLSLIK